MPDQPWPNPQPWLKRPAIPQILTLYNIELYKPSANTGTKYAQGYYSGGVWSTPTHTMIALHKDVRRWQRSIAQRALRCPQCRQLYWVETELLLAWRIAGESFTVEDGQLTCSRRCPTCTPEGT